jgi:hypothetical protein
MSEYPHERNDYATYAPSDTLSEDLDDDLQALQNDELDDLALPSGDESDNDLDALHDDREDDIPAANGSGVESNNHRTTRVRRAIERHKERIALRAQLADGYADSWDTFDSGDTSH